jgi:UDP-3-O-[3-hydroxymyristoyl] glucosamine N-acyltransferase
MVFKKPINIEELANFLGREYQGNSVLIATGINEIHRVKEGDISFVDHPKYYDACLNSDASIIIINKAVACPEGKALIISPNPAEDFNRINQSFNPFIASRESISSSASIGEDTIVQPNVFIGHNVKIGKNCLIHAGVSIMNDVEIGDYVIIGMNSVIGSDAFYFKKRKQYDKFHTAGNVIIHDHVEIGASCTIDRGLTSNTIIGKGTKIDNQVQIAHDNEIGENCLFAAQVAIAGCCTIGDNVTMWGQVGVTSSITIGDNAIILGQSGVSKSLAGGKTYFGNPAGESYDKFKEMAFLRKLFKDYLRK